MKKKLLFMLFIICLIINYFYLDLVARKLDSNDYSIINSNDITMFVETAIDSGKYQKYELSTWPNEGYLFNKELSKCTNGASLTYDSVNNNIVMSASKSDKCIVYFDKTPELTITSVSISSNCEVDLVTLNSIVLNKTVSIAKYAVIINSNYVYEFSSVGSSVGEKNGKHLNFSKGDSIEVYAITVDGVKSNSYYTIDDKDHYCSSTGGS